MVAKDDSVKIKPISVMKIKIAGCVLIILLMSACQKDKDIANLKNSIVNWDRIYKSSSDVDQLKDRSIDEIFRAYPYFGKVSWSISDKGDGSDPKTILLQCRIDANSSLYDKIDLHEAFNPEYPLILGVNIECREGDGESYAEKYSLIKSSSDVEGLFYKIHPMCFLKQTSNDEVRLVLAKSYDVFEDVIKNEVLNSVDSGNLPNKAIIKKLK